MRAVAALVASLAGSASAQLQAGSVVSAEDAARPLPVLRSVHPWVEEGSSVTLQGLSDAGLTVVIDKSHCG